MTKNEVREILYLATDVLQIAHNFSTVLQETDKDKLAEIYRTVIETIPSDFVLEEDKDETPTNNKTEFDF